ncbi:MAG TPA: hypothetical protein VLJ86_01595 [Ramlibacter sp.]|nr:hypothetical protein [Ramlibacter sp.]
MRHAELMTESPITFQASDGEPPLEACDEIGDENRFDPTYCPAELLGQFSLLMAGHGRCVSAAMMLGDREYAMWQLARAHATDDVALRRLAARLFAWLQERG